jgi:hypothetical protein
MKKHFNNVHSNKIDSLLNQTFDMKNQKKDKIKLSSNKLIHFN